MTAFYYIDMTQEELGKPEYRELKEKFLKAQLLGSSFAVSSKMEDVPSSNNYMDCFDEDDFFALVLACAGVLSDDGQGLILKDKDGKALADEKGINSGNSEVSFSVTGFSMKNDSRIKEMKFRVTSEELNFDSGDVTIRDVEIHQEGEGPVTFRAVFKALVNEVEFCIRTEYDFSYFEDYKISNGQRT